MQQFSIQSTVTDRLQYAFGINRAPATLTVCWLKGAARAIGYGLLLPYKPPVVALGFRVALVMYTIVSN